MLWWTASLRLALPHERAGRSRSGSHDAPLEWRAPSASIQSGCAPGLIGGLGDRSAGQALDVGQCLAPIGVRRFWPHGQSFEVNEGHVSHAKEAEHRPEIRLLEVEGGKG